MALTKVISPPAPKHVFILSGGIGAGKTAIVNRLKAQFHYISGSPADVMKESLARHIAEQWNEDGTDDGWEVFYAEMLTQATKAKYRLLLQGFGEFFSDQDNYYWANQCVEKAATEYETLALAGVPSGIVFDSIRRDSEILAVKARWEHAVHIRLVVHPARQIEYLTTILGLSIEKAESTLAHSSEHWLDDMEGSSYDAQYVLNADQGDDTTWAQLMGVVVLLMDKTTLELAHAITEASPLA